MYIVCLLSYRHPAAFLVTHRFFPYIAFFFCFLKKKFFFTVGVHAAVFDGAWALLFFACDGEAVDGRNMSNGCVHLIDPGSDVLQ